MMDTFQGARKDSAGYATLQDTGTHWQHMPRSACSCPVTHSQLQCPQKPSSFRDPPLCGPHDLLDVDGLGIDSSRHNLTPPVEATGLNIPDMHCVFLPCNLPIPPNT
ncbi:hypothetical protein AAFF_G00198710 [Aldrovandia affinis]|uniref:Uncharacterized protein n=1 Tax=Aldrovandia affinis TaxID=143900 RepID=A0AAD7RIQ4_9TELE|nr:hypothetical protein AAFF_G00198710 [Aldrovandia affinis]